MNKLGLNPREFLNLLEDAPVLVYKRIGTDGGKYWIPDEVIDVLMKLQTIKNKENEHRIE